MKRKRRMIGIDPGRSYIDSTVDSPYDDTVLSFAKR